MAYPTFVESVSLAETTDTDTHNLNAFASAAVGDTYWGIFCFRRTPARNVAVTMQPGLGQASTHNYTNKSGVVNEEMSITVLYGIIRDGDPLNSGFQLKTNFQICVAAAVIGLFRGARDQTKDTASRGPTLGTANNPGLQRNPGLSVPGVDRMPARSSNVGPTDDAKSVVAFARVGNNTFNADIVDQVGSGISDGAPYAAFRERDMNTGSEQPPPDGACTTPFAMIAHAESSDLAGWLCQVGMAHRDIPSAEWLGHPSWTPYIYKGQIGFSYWPVNPNNSAATPTGQAGIRLHI